MKFTILLFASFSILFLNSSSLGQPSIENSFVFKNGVLLYHNQKVDSLFCVGHFCASNITEFEASRSVLYICQNKDSVSYEIPYTSIQAIDYYKGKKYLLIQLIQ
jgi:hypothetical protein